MLVGQVGFSYLNIIFKIKKPKKIITEFHLNYAKNYYQVKEKGKFYFDPLILPKFISYQN